MVDKLGDALRFHQNALNVRAYRQQLIASNIANADTPHYKARDVDFRQALSGAVAGRGGSLAVQKTSARHLSAGNASPLGVPVLYRTEQQSSVDGNTVNLDAERAAFAENSLQYEASVTFINGFLRSMASAVTGQ